MINDTSSANIAFRRRALRPFPPATACVTARRFASRFGKTSPTSSPKNPLSAKQDKVIKVPLRGIKEYRFIYGENTPGVGQGDGDAHPGQVVGKTGKEGQGKGDGRAGDRPGVDYYETDVSLEELIDIMFEDPRATQSGAPRVAPDSSDRSPDARVTVM